jgi:hypothetical protein
LAPLLALGLPPLVAAARIETALPYLFALVFLAGGSTMGAFRMGLSNYLFELASDEERPRYIAVMSTLAMPGALVPLAVGWALNFISFPMLFLCLATGGATAVAISATMPNRRS